MLLALLPFLAAVEPPSTVGTFDAAGMALVMGGEKPAFVKFEFLPCDFCAALDTFWEKLSDLYPGVVWRVDCNAHPAVCEARSVKEDPTKPAHLREPIIKFWMGSGFRRYSGELQPKQLLEYLQRKLTPQQNEALLAEAQQRAMQQQQQQQQQGLSDDARKRLEFMKPLPIKTRGVQPTSLVSLDPAPGAAVPQVAQQAELWAAMPRNGGDDQSDDQSDEPELTEPEPEELEQQQQQSKTEESEQEESEQEESAPEATEPEVSEPEATDAKSSEVMEDLTDDEQTALETAEKASKAAVRLTEKAKSAGDGIPVLQGEAKEAASALKKLTGELDEVSKAATDADSEAIQAEQEARDLARAVDLARQAAETRKAIAASKAQEAAGGAGIRQAQQVSGDIPEIPGIADSSSDPLYKPMRTMQQQQENGTLPELDNASQQQQTDAKQQQQQQQQQQLEQQTQQQQSGAPKQPTAAQAPKQAADSGAVPSHQDPKGLRTSPEAGLGDDDWKQGLPRLQTLPTIQRARQEKEGKVDEGPPPPY